MEDEEEEEEPTKMKNMTMLHMFIEFVASIALILLHIKTDFMIPSLGFGSYFEVGAAMAFYTMMIIPFAARLQATVLKIPLCRCMEGFIIALGAVAYEVAGSITVYDWVRNLSNNTIFFRGITFELALFKGVTAILLGIFLMLDGAHLYFFKGRKWKDS